MLTSIFMKSAPYSDQQLEEMSFVELGRIAGVRDTTIHERIKSGLTRREAVDKVTHRGKSHKPSPHKGKKVPNSLVTGWGESKSYSSWERDDRNVHGLSRATIRKRVTKGYSLEEALSTPPTRSGPTGQTLKIEHGDNSLTVRETAKAVGLSEPAARARIAKGASLEAPERIWTMYEYNGERYTLPALARRLGVSESAILHRLHNGLPFDTPVRRAWTYEAWGESKTASEWFEDSRCVATLESLRKRLFDGWVPEEAMTTVVKDPPQYEAWGESKTLAGWLNDERCAVDNATTLHNRLNIFYDSNERAISDQLRPANSAGERELGDFIESLGLEIIRNDRSVLGRKELDIYIPSLNTGVEYNGVFWHSDYRKDGNSHYEKWQQCTELGVRLFQIWEDDWRDRRSAVQQMIAHKLGASSQPRVGARQLEVGPVTARAAAAFLNENHIQGVGSGGSVRLGLWGDSGLAACMLMASNADGWELTRFATSVVVRGGFQKLMAAFVNEYDGPIKTFADLCVSDGRLYEASGFRCDGFVPPDYKYVYKGRRVHKKNFRKVRFKNDPNLFYQDGMTQAELADLNSLKRIWDAGKLRYVLDN